MRSGQYAAASGEGLRKPENPSRESRASASRTVLSKRAGELTLETSQTAEGGENIVAVLTRAGPQPQGQVGQPQARGLLAPHDRMLFAELPPGQKRAMLGHLSSIFQPERRRTSPSPSNASEEQRQSSGCLGRCRKLPEPPLRSREASSQGDGLCGLAALAQLAQVAQLLGMLDRGRVHPGSRVEKTTES